MTRIAVIGAGVSGLVAAHLLGREHDVTVFEAADYAGGHANTVRVDDAEATHWLETGFMVFNDRNYPGFEGLLGSLGITSQRSDMSFSVSNRQDGFEFASTSLNGLFAKRSHFISLSFWRILKDFTRYQALASELNQGSGYDLSLGDWANESGFSPAFVNRILVPVVSSIWSADPTQVANVPARFVSEFLGNHGLLGLRNRPTWRTVVGGSRSYVNALTEPLGDRLLLSTPIREIRRHTDRVVVVPHGGEGITFDEVVVATHSDQALGLLGDADSLEQDVLSAFPYQTSEVVLHTDERMLPRRRRAWASWNYHLFADSAGKPALTYHLNRLQALDSDKQFCVTLNNTTAIDPHKVLRSFAYAHPVFTRRGVAAQSRHKEISGRNRTHFCGAYWGFGFHEDGLSSAQAVADSFGMGRI